MKKLILLAVTLFSLTSAHSIELVCEGASPRDSRQRAVIVNCSDRKAVIEILGAAWQTLRKEQIGGSTEDMCWQPYTRAKDLHPSISFNGIAQTFFAQCNMALRYVK
jgi:hypothetical protein